MFQPRMGPLEPEDAATLLLGLYAVNLRQLRDGAPLPSPALHSGRLVYLRGDPYLRTIRGLFYQGGGDCKSLAPAVAAEWTHVGRPALPVVYWSGPHLMHAVVQDQRTGRLYCPSTTGGM